MLFLTLNDFAVQVTRAVLNNDQFMLKTILDTHHGKYHLLTTINNVSLAVQIAELATDAQCEMLIRFNNENKNVDSKHLIEAIIFAAAKKNSRALLSSLLASPNPNWNNAASGAAAGNHRELTFDFLNRSTRKDYNLAAASAARQNHRDLTLELLQMAGEHADYSQTACNAAARNHRELTVELVTKCTTPDYNWIACNAVKGNHRELTLELLEIAGDEADYNWCATIADREGHAELARELQKKAAEKTSATQLSSTSSGVHFAYSSAAGLVSDPAPRTLGDDNLTVNSSDLANLANTPRI